MRSCRWLSAAGVHLCQNGAMLRCAAPAEASRVLLILMEGQSTTAGALLYPRGPLWWYAAFHAMVMEFLNIHAPYSGRGSRMGEGSCLVRTPEINLTGS